MTRENNPLETGYGKFCRLDGAIDCIGLAALQDIAASGPDRMIRGIRFDGAPCPACYTPWPVSVAGEEVGQVTSAAWSPRFRANIGLSLVEHKYWQAGQPVSATTPDGAQRNGIVCDLPFCD